MAGLCSVTLRGEPIDAIARLAHECGLSGIEWGADVHVPPGNTQAAHRARDASAAAGVELLSYGTYLLAGDLPSDADIECALDTAVALGAPNVRIWTPIGDEPESARRGEIVAAVARVSELAALRSLTVGIEYHGGTLTATRDSAQALLAEVGAPNLHSYWQPSYWFNNRTVADDIADVRALGSSLSHLHVYEWTGATERRPLACGETRWRAVIDGLVPSVTPRAAFLEFVEDDDTENVRRDAATLRGLIGATT
jgi:sugar phosphate isomerase/epimerase